MYGAAIVPPHTDTLTDREGRENGDSNGFGED